MVERCCKCKYHNGNDRSIVPTRRYSSHGNWLLSSECHVSRCYSESQYCHAMEVIKVYIYASFILSKRSGKLPRSEWASLPADAAIIQKFGEYQTVLAMVYRGISYKVFIS